MVYAGRQMLWAFAAVATFSVVCVPVAGKESSTAKYEDLLLHRSGFARSVTGGAGGKVVVIDKLDCGLLRSALKGDEKKWIRFKSGLKGEIEIEGDLRIGSNTTIDGRGAEITLTSPDDCDQILFEGKDENWKDEKRSNLIVHNIKIIREGKGDNRGSGSSRQASHLETSGRQAFG